MPIQHIVAFEYDPAKVTSSTLTTISQAFLELQKTCLDRETNEPYIVKLVGGKQDSPEGKHQGMTHVFLVEFKTEADRQYYLDTDPAHVAFKALIGPTLKSAIVLDFTQDAW